MRIRELTLRNYRAFAEPPPFSFGDRFTVIAGINGTGKTALLEGLALLCSRILPLISPARSGYRTISPSEVHLNATSVELAMKANCAGIPLEYKLTYTREDNKIVTSNLTAVVKRTVRNAYGDPTRSDDAAPLAVYYTTDRAGYRLPKKLPTEVPRGQAAAYTGALLNRTVNFKDFMARYRSAIVIGNEERDNPSFLGARAVSVISEALTTFLGGFENLRIEEEPLRLKVDKGGVPLDISQLSDGERSFLAIVCDLGRRLALANPKIENPLHGAGVVLIDELELHLHPKWQREVVEKLRTTFPNIQFIATTHSPQIIGELSRDEVRLLRPEGIVTPSVARGADSNWILDHVMDGAASENLTARQLKDEAETALANGDLSEAHVKLEALRRMLDGDTGELVRLESSLYALETLARDTDEDENA
jgi:predicted ATP-binding protein involved in virulence